MKEPKRIIRIQLVTREQKSQPNSARPLRELLNKFLEKMNLTAEYCPRVYSLRGLNFRLHVKNDNPAYRPDMVLVNLDTLVNDGDISINDVKKDYKKIIFAGLSSSKTKQSVINMGYDGYLPTLFNQMNLKELFKDKSKIDLTKLPVVDELEKDDHRPNRTPVSTSAVHSDNRSDKKHNWNNSSKHNKFNRNNHKDDHKSDLADHDSDHKSQDNDHSSDWTEVKRETSDHKPEESVKHESTDSKSEQSASKKEFTEKKSEEASSHTSHKPENESESDITDTADTDQHSEEKTDTEANKGKSESSGNKISDKSADKAESDKKSEDKPEEKTGFAVKVEANGEQKLDQDDHAKDSTDSKSEEKDDDASLEDDLENINFDDVSGDGIELNVPDSKSEEKTADRDNDSEKQSGKKNEEDKHDDDKQGKPFNVLADLKKDKDDSSADSKSENADHDGKSADKKSGKNSALEDLGKLMSGGKKPKDDDPVVTGSGNDTPLAPDQGAGDTDTKKKKKDWTLDRPMHDSKNGILSEDDDDGDLDKLKKLLNHQVVMDDPSDVDADDEETKDN